MARTPLSGALLKRGAPALVAVLTLPVLSACGSGGSSSADDTLRIVQGQTPNQFDPCGPANGSESAAMAAIYAPLVRTVPATGELEPGIATEWEVNESATEFTFTLQTGLTFQDDTTLDAEAVKRSLEQCLEIGNQVLPTLESIDAPAEDTLVITTSAPTSGMVGLLGNRLGMIASPTAREESGDQYGASPVGAGPYELTDFVPGSSLTLTRWDDYQDAGLSGDGPGTIEVSVITDPSAQAAALTGDQADIGYRLDYTAPDGLEGTDITVDIGLGVSMPTLNFDRSQGPTEDVRVRQAISYAIDRQALAEANTNGLADEPAVQPYPEGHRWHFDDLDDAYPYDPERARELLAEAGYADGLTLRGVTLDGPAFINNALVVSDQLSAVGITVEFEPLDVPEASKAFLMDHRFDVMSTGSNAGPDWFSVYRRLLSTYSSGNPGNIPVPGGEEVLAAANAALDDEALDEALRQAAEVLIEQLPMMPLYYSPFVTAYSERVTGVDEAFSLNGEIDYTALGLSS